ncbi:MAG TPA: dihydroneopterin aldolase [Sphingobacterium sp.]|nr:dihydroneopterin aldolase [Sphingobacterium sp.]
MIVQKVALSDVRFFSPIGYYDEEQVIGNEFLVSVEVYFTFKNSNAEELENTINYEELYHILVEIMTPRRKLLESAVEDILARVVKEYNYLTKAVVTIRKINPPFGGDLANAEVTLSYDKE